MSILINKDGAQLGPYSLDEVRALVLAGKLDPLDWAWPDGGDDWVQLKDIPGYAQIKPVTVPVAAVPAARAAAAGVAASPAVANPIGANPTGTAIPPEEEMWSGHPSQALNADVYGTWGLVLIVTLGVLVAFHAFTESGFWTAIIFGAVALIGGINCGVAYFHLKAIHYVVSTQRVRVVSGLFSKTIQEIELFRVKDTMAQQSFLLRLLGLGTITILSGDAKEPRLVLTGIPNAIELREKLRQEVMNVRQRFGVREVDVM